MVWIVYILECRDRSLYTGVTKDLDRRILEHEEGRGAKYTRGRGPFKVRYKEAQPSRSAALRREMEIKSMRRSAKRALIAMRRADRGGES